MPNGDEQKLAILREMGSIVDKLDSSISKYEKRLTALELTHIEKDAFNTTVNELRKYTDNKMEDGIERGQKALDDKIGLARAGLYQDFEKLIKEQFDEFENKRLVPLFEQLLEDRAAAEQAEKDMKIERLQKRAAAATAVILFLVACWQTFRPTPDSARDYVRPVERLSDVVN